MQRFVAQLSRPIDPAEFERSWKNEQSLIDTQPKVEFVFLGQRVSAVVHSECAAPWPSAGFHHAFSLAIRRLNRVCNIRWL